MLGTRSLFQLARVFLSCSVSQRLLHWSAPQCRLLYFQSGDGLAAAERPANVPVVSFRRVLFFEPSKAKCRVSAVSASFEVKTTCFLTNATRCAVAVNTAITCSVHPSPAAHELVAYNRLRDPSSGRLRRHHGLLFCVRRPSDFRRATSSRGHPRILFYCFSPVRSTTSEPASRSLPLVVCVSSSPVRHSLCEIRLTRPRVFPSARPTSCERVNRDVL